MTTEQQANEALTEMHNIAMKGEPILDDDLRWDIVGNFITQAAEDKRIADAVRGGIRAQVHGTCGEYEGRIFTNIDGDTYEADDQLRAISGQHILIVPASVLEEPTNDN